MSDRVMNTPDDVVAERLDVVREAIAEVGRNDVRIVAVTKGFDRSAMDCAQRIGLADVGENYAQELLGKLEAVMPGTRVHFMGRIQRNKVRKIASSVDVWHSVTRSEIVSEIHKRTMDADRPNPELPKPDVLIQVRPHDDDTKDGVRPSELEGILSAAADTGLAVAGLMTIGVLGDPTATRDAFEELVMLADRYELAERSMGMSGDYRDALAAGATTLRLGSVLFGARPNRENG